MAASTRMDFAENVWISGELFESRDYIIGNRFLIKVLIV